MRASSNYRHPWSRQRRRPTARKRAGSDPRLAASAAATLRSNLWRPNVKCCCSPAPWRQHGRRRRLIAAAGLSGALRAALAADMACNAMLGHMCSPPSQHAFTALCCQQHLCWRPQASMPSHQPVLQGSLPGSGHITSAHHPTCYRRRNVRSNPKPSSFAGAMPAPARRRLLRAGMRGAAPS